MPKEIFTLEEYIEHLQCFCNLYELNDDMAEEVEIYKLLISWLKELKRYRNSKGKYVRQSNFTQEGTQETVYWV